MSRGRLCGWEGARLRRKESEGEKESVGECESVCVRESESER